jgi:uncharacterized membrane protein YGL010W
LTSLLASVVASLVAWGLSALLDGHVSAVTDTVLGFVVWAVVFVPTFVAIKRVRDGG